MKLPLKFLTLFCAFAGLGITLVAADAAPRGGGGGGRAAAAANREQRIEQREANQQHRIDEGIKHGQLTPDEVATLNQQETNIKTLDASFKSDGKLSKTETQQLKKALNDASVQIWAQRHDTEGNQKPVSRLGKDVFAQDSLTAKIESGDLTKSQAHEFLGEFHKMVNLKHRLSTDNLSADQRTKLQGQYNELLNKYFLIK